MHLVCLPLAEACLGFPAQASSAWLSPSPRHDFLYIYSELFEVFALFGMGAELVVRAYDKFGWDVDNEKYQPRLYFNCPWLKNC